MAKSPSLVLLRPTANLFGEVASASLFETDRRTDVLRPMDLPCNLDTRPRRRKLWELADALHCSIIGTCLSNGDLRRVLVKLRSPGAETAEEHDLHVVAVSVADKREAGSKFLHKALDNRHAAAIRQYAAAKDEATLTRLWNESLHKGDIPGAYWAVITHPCASEAIVKTAFQNVHMLSHLMGAANPADIRRLRQLEKENEALANKLRRQEMHLRDGFCFRDRTIQMLREMLAQRSGNISSAVPTGCDGGEPRHEMISVLNRKLGREEARRQRLERRLGAVSAALQTARAELRAVERDRDALTRDLETIEREVGRLIEPSGDSAKPSLAGDTYLYIGGRTCQIPQIKAWVERAGGRLLHHDGGIEHSPSLLPGLIGRADVLCFPVDCVSDDAVATVKRLCRKVQKPYLPLRTSSVAALIAALSGQPRADVSAAE